MMERLIRVALIASLAWSAFAFGAVYPWAYWPAFTIAGLAGLAGILRRASRIPIGAAIGAIVILCAVSLQLVPLAQPRLSAVSPSADRLLRSYHLSYAVTAPGGNAAHPVSIDPPKTSLALASLAVCLLMMFGTACTLTRETVGSTARGLIAIGTVLAIVGLVQMPFYAGKVYGLWTPLAVGATPFGPFINRNHFAGWMLMTLPLGIGYLFSRAERAGRTGHLDWRRRVLWFASSDANQLALIGAGLLVMAIALVLTMSRSGILGLAGAVTAAAIFTVRKKASCAPTGLRVAFLVCVLLVGFGWGGVDAVNSRFTAHDVGNLDGRLAAWTDASRVAHAFPLTGTGLNTYGTAMLFYQTADTARHYSAAHNDYLQLMAEGGLLVSIPAVFGIVMFGAAVGRRLREVRPGASEYWIRIGAISGLIGVAIQESADFSLQIPANALLFAVIAGIALRPAEPVSQKTS